MVQRSSGTTGTPTEIYFTRQMHAFELAVAEARSVNCAGADYRSRRVMFGARKVCDFAQQRPPFWRFSPIERLAYASIYHLSPQNIPYYIEFLREFRPAVVMGYPNALNGIAQYALEHDRMPAPAKAVITTSETVTKEIRNALEAAWHCRVWDRYGAVECCVFASQCEHGRYHVSPEAGVIEILDSDGRPCAPGMIGEVVCTGLQNTLQPLIRYRLGDLACWTTDPSCACGRAMPILERIEGRIEDVCVTPDGRGIVRFDTVFKGVATIREAQVVQEGLGQFVIRVVPGQGYSEDDARRIRENMLHHVGELAIAVETVDRISRRSSGKFQAVVCKLPAAEVKARLRGGTLT